MLSSVLPAGTEPRKLEAKPVCACSSCVPAVSWLYPAGEGSALGMRNLGLAEANRLKVLLRHGFSVFMLLRCIRLAGVEALAVSLLSG